MSCSTKSDKTLFERKNPDATGIVFSNQLTENDSVNILDNEFVYNGSGVGIGDLNGDGLEDLFLAGNQVNNALYLNKGKLKFEDITLAAGIGKPSSFIWSSGVNIVDVNLDGKLDVYVSNTFYRDSVNRRNLLYINSGVNSQGIPTFQEQATAYGIADDSYSSHAQFFDYDNDGDLDLFIGVNRIEGINPSQFRPIEDNGQSMSRDRLYRNDWDANAGHPVFTNVSSEAGIIYHGYSHSTIIHDFNQDGWADIYVANDFFSNDLIYINNQDGTFTNRAGDIFKHFSLSSMGSDLADVNSDGELDLFTTEMQPYYNKRKKLFQGPSSYDKEIFTRRYDYEYQYARNTLQISNGSNPETGLPIFSETGMFAGVQETDWSWAPLFADYDNDSWQDLIITNGFPKDVTDRDFGDFRVTGQRLLSKEDLIAAIPEIKIPNFAFKNNGDLSFSDVTDSWGFNFGTFSSGAAYGDLDGDGDLDLVINNLNEPVTLLENHSREMHPELNYLRISLDGPTANAQGFGSMVSVYLNGHIQKLTSLSGRGYLSKPESTLHFGLGKSNKADSVLIQWPDGKTQKLIQVASNQTLRVHHKDASSKNIKSAHQSTNTALMQEVSAQKDLDILVRDIDFIDFNFQRTLPHKFSQYGPALSAGDVNGDGLTDVFVPGSRSFAEQFLMQQMDGSFIAVEVNFKESESMEEEDTATLLFDADGDGDLDLYVGRGSAQYDPQDSLYRDQLLINDGLGNYTALTSGLPEITANTSVVKAADFDRDGDLDLFVGSRVLPFAYPKADRSYLLRNDTHGNTIQFTDVTASVGPVLEYAGLISDAIWSDFNGDNHPDLILASEWSPLRFFENKNGKLLEITNQTGVEEDKGWWNSLSAADLDNDGDIDYIAGNSGSNCYFKGTKTEPVRLYAKDLDDNGMIDPLLSYYLRDSLGIKHEYLYHPWQDVVKQFAGIRKYFNSFGSFGASTLPEMFNDGLLNDAEILELNTSASSWFENLGNNTFKRHPLPLAAQIAPIYGILSEDLDSDGNTDLILVGNDFGMEVQQGRSDALNGLVLKNDGQGNFTSLNNTASGFYVPGDAKALIRLISADGKNLWIASQNNNHLKAFESKETPTVVALKANEVKARVTKQNGATRVVEFHWGSGFLSQSQRILQFNPVDQKIEFYNQKGEITRVVSGKNTIGEQD
ncbi:MAG: hypothetical protein RLZZ241_936 [Bacteroidota bacterium]|jgi:hypothetical protein